MNSVGGIQTPSLATPALESPVATKKDGGVDFAKVLGQAIDSANEIQKNAEHEARELAAGRGDTLDAVLAITKADMSLRFISGVRNRALEAFNEIMRMPV